MSSSDRPTRGVTDVSKRNMMWLAAVILVGVLVWLAVSIVAGLIAAVIMLAISEVVERKARAERRRAANDAAKSS